MARSCSGCAYACSRQTATASAPVSRTAAASSSRPESSRSTPSGVQRSRAAIRRSGGTSGAGCSAHRRYRSARAWRPSATRSVKPSVATSAVRAPLPSSSALVATVMPCANVSTSCGSRCARSSAARTASITPRDWSSGVLGALAVTRRPSSSARTASVNVPPTSTPNSIVGRDPTAYGVLGRDRLLDLLGRREMLVRRAVAVVRQRYALTRGALARGGATLQRVAVDVVAVLRLTLQPLVGELDEARDRRAHARLLAHRKVDADVVEQRAGGTLEVVAVRRQPFHRRLTGAKDRRMSIDAARGGVAADVRRELAVDGPGELVHTTLSSSSCCSPWRRIVRHPCKGQNASSVEFALSTGGRAQRGLVMPSSRTLDARSTHVRDDAGRGRGRCSGNRHDGGRRATPRERARTPR